MMLPQLSIIVKTRQELSALVLISESGGRWIQTRFERGHVEVHHSIVTRCCDPATNYDAVEENASPGGIWVGNIQ